LLGALAAAAERRRSQAPTPHNSSSVFIGFSRSHSQNAPHLRLANPSSGSSGNFSGKPALRRRENQKFPSKFLALTAQSKRSEIKLKRFSKDFYHLIAQI